MSPELLDSAWWEWDALAVVMTFMLYVSCSSDDPPGAG